MGESISDDWEKNVKILITEVLLTTEFLNYINCEQTLKNLFSAIKNSSFVRKGVQHIIRQRYLRLRKRQELIEIYDHNMDKAKWIKMCSCLACIERVDGIVILRKCMCLACMKSGKGIVEFRN
jgi:hypothetical protein